MCIVPSLPAHAANDPTLAVADANLTLPSRTTTFSVPIAFDTGSAKVASVAFTLQYDPACVRINNPNTDIAGTPNGFSVASAVDAAQGRLQMSIYKSGSQKNVQVPSGVAARILFTLEPTCRAANSYDAVFSFVGGSVSFGLQTGSSMSGVGAAGVYHLTVNQNPTAIGYAVGAYVNGLKENVTGLRAVGVLSATDVYSVGLTFALAAACSGTFDNLGFSVDPANSSRLMTDRTFDYEGQALYHVCVQVNDGLDGVLAAIVTLNVVNVNEAPYSIYWQNDDSSVLEHQPVGEVVGTLGAFDNDAGDADAMTFSLVDGDGSADNASFQVAGAQIHTQAEFDYAAKSEYHLRMRATDPGGLSHEMPFIVSVTGQARLSLPTQPDVPWVMNGHTIAIPVSFDPKGNAVRSAAFQVNFATDCLDFSGLGNPQNFTAAATSTDAGVTGTVTVTLSSAGATLARGVIVNLEFLGTRTDTCRDSRWTKLTFPVTPQLLNTSGAAVPVLTTAGDLIRVHAEDIIGDCNDDGVINAGDLAAEAIEYFEDETAGLSGPIMNPRASLWSVLGEHDFSILGCDSNQDQLLDASDLVCTARTIFGASCGTAGSAGAPQPAVVAAPTSVTAGAEDYFEAPILLETGGNQVAAVALSVDVNPALAAFDPSDADGNGIPDAVTFAVPNSLVRMALYDPAAHKVHLLITGMALPLPTIQNGVLATVRLRAATGGIRTLPIALSDVSMGDTEGRAVATATAGSDAFQSLPPRAFLPAVVR